MKLSAVLLAAGRSTRMGQDKALLSVKGQPLWRRQRDVLKSAGVNEIFLSARPEQIWAGEADGFAAVLHDAYPDCGPISGVTAGLERMAQSHLVALAVDLPRISVSWLLRMIAECSLGVGVVGQRGEFFEPLAAVYPAEMKWLAWETFARGEYSMQTLVADAVKGGQLRVRKIADEEAPWFENWNDPSHATG